MIKSFCIATAIALTPLTLTQTAQAHCQIPCGIYDDANVVSDLHTHYVTIEKSAGKLAAGGLSQHDSARWVMNKENHCEYIIQTVTDYFLAQRLKTSEMKSDKDAYLKKLVLCHQTIVAAMKCKQNADAAALKNLEELVKGFSAFLPAKK